MSIYEMILDRLKEVGINYTENQLINCDIIEYMVLESAGALHALQGKNLTCNIDIHKSSFLLQFGLKELALSAAAEIPESYRPALTDFLSSVSIINNRYPNGKESWGPANRNRMQYGIYLAKTDLKQAIHTSSVFIAAGDLSKLDLKSLLLLIAKLNFYKIADAKITTLVTSLAHRVNTYIINHFEPEAIQKAIPLVQKEADALMVFSKNEQHFNMLLHRFKKFSDFVEKTSEGYPPGSINSHYDPTYLEVAAAATLLQKTLFQARDDFFNNPVSSERFQVFKKTCLDAINAAKTEFAKFRGWGKWYNDLHPVLKGLITCLKAIAGIIAAITIVPAVLTEVYTTEGYVGTFFSTKTDSLKKLETLEHQFIDENGVFEGLNKGIL